MKTWIKYSILLLVVLMVGILFYQRIYLPKSTFKTISLDRGEVRVEVMGVGTVSAKNIYKVGAQSSGKIMTIETDEGLWVEQGALIATIDPVDLPLQLNEAELAVNKATYELQALRKEQEGLLAQKHLATMTFERYETLFKQGYAAQVEFDKAVSDLQSIEAQIEATQARIRSSNEEVARMKKSVESLQVKLSKYQVYAPISGYVISKDAEVAQNVLPTQPVITMVNPQSVWVEVYIDERISGAVEVNQSARITLRSHSTTPLPGYVARINAMSDAVTQEREVNVFFKKTPIPFYINEQAEVSIVTNTITDVLRVPLSLMRHYQGKEGVWVLKEDQAHFVALKVQARGTEYAAVDGDLKRGDRMIVPDSQKKPLAEGMKVYQ